MTDFEQKVTVCCFVVKFFSYHYDVDPTLRITFWNEQRDYRFSHPNGWKLHILWALELRRDQHSLDATRTIDSVEWTQAQQSRNILLEGGRNAVGR